MVNARLTYPQCRLGRTEVHWKNFINCIQSKHLPFGGLSLPYQNECLADYFQLKCIMVSPYLIFYLKVSGRNHLQ